MFLGKVVIGSCIASAYYALINDCYFIPTRKHPPMFYRENVERWPKLNFMLGILSKRICYDETETIRLIDNQIRISAQGTTYKYDFESCKIFNPTGVQLENEISTPIPKTYLVIDDFELSTLGGHHQKIQPVSINRDFAREIHFYCSERVDGATYITDCVVESELTEEQINCFDYSDTMARFVVERHLTSVGIYGTFMEYYKSGKPKYRKPKVHHAKRLVFEKDNNKYRDTEYVKIVDSSLEDMIEEISQR